MIWEYAFRFTGGSLGRELHEDVLSQVEALGYSYDTDEDYIHTVYDEDGDEVWSCEWDRGISNQATIDSIRHHLPNELLDHLDEEFPRDAEDVRRIRKASKLVVGKATKLPLPGSRP